MKRILVKTSLLLVLLCCQSNFALSGLFFNITVSGATLSITTTIPNHVYPKAGIKINTPGYTLKNIGTECQLASSGYCLFSTSNTSPATITISGPTGMLSATLCLNGVGALSCQKYNLSVNAQRTTYTAVGGFYYNSFSDYHPSSYISRDSGKTWALSATQPIAQTTENYLLSVACSTDGQQCAALGANDLDHIPSSYTSSDGGNTWNVSTIQPPLYPSSGNSNITDVTCSSNGQQCVAVGYYRTGVDHPLTYISRDGGNTWAFSTIQPSSVNSHDSYLNGVACDSSGQLCAAVGLYTEGSGMEKPLSYTSADGGNSWTLSTTLPPAQGNGNNELLSIACDSSGLICTTVGDYKNNSPIFPSSYTSIDGGKNWALSTTPPAAQGSVYNILKSVTCDVSGLLCTTVGYYSSNNNTYLPLSYTTSDGGKNWALSTTLPPLFSVSAFPYSVACDTSGQVCTSVGYYESSGTPPYGPVSYTSADGGKNWSLSTTLPPSPPASDDFGSWVYGVA